MTVATPAARPAANPTDYRVADIALADWGRREMQIAEGEMPALMASRSRARASRARST